MRTQSLKKDLFGKLNTGIIVILLLATIISVVGFYFFTLSEVEDQTDTLLTKSEETINENFLMILREIKSINEIMESLKIYKSNDENMVALINSNNTLFTEMAITGAMDVSLNSLEKYTVQDLDIYYTDAYFSEDQYYFDLYFQWRDRQVMSFKVNYERLFSGLPAEISEIKVLNRTGDTLYSSGGQVLSDEIFNGLQDKKLKSINEYKVNSQGEKYYLSYINMSIFNQYILAYVPESIVLDAVFFFAIYATVIFLGVCILISIIIARVNGKIRGTLKKLEDKTVSVHAMETMGPLEISTYDEFSEIYMKFFTLSENLRERDQRINELEKELESKPAEEKVNEDKEALMKHNTYLKQSIENLQSNQEKIVENEKLMALGGLVTGIAHEISTPVGVSYTSASYMNKIAKDIKIAFEEDEMTKRQFNDFLNATIESSGMICNNLEKASSLVQGFKNDASTQTSMQMEEFELCHLIRDIYGEIMGDLKALDIDFKIDCEGYVNMYADPGKYRDIFSNLIMNSIIHGFENKETGQIHVDISSDDKMVHIRFKDNGKGIEEQYVKKIYDPFFTTKRGKGGSGLGLNIVYTLIKNSLKGDIKVESIPDVGTTFHIEFPKIAKF